MRKFIVGAAAAAMVVGSTAAQAAPVSAPVAIEDARSGSVVGAEAFKGEGGTHLLLGLFAAILLGVVLWQINDNDADDGFPISP